MSKHYVIRYRNAPGSKGTDVYLVSMSGSRWVGDSDPTLSHPFESRQEAENFLLEHPTYLTVCGVAPDPTNRKHHLMADIALQYVE